MSAAEFTSSTIQRAWEPPEEVVVPYALAYDPVLQPEDYGVLIRLLLRDPGKPAGVLALAEEFQASGWKMGASRLRGVMARLKKAGHVSHRQAGYDPGTRRPSWAFAVYRNPANNPEYVESGTAAASQVRPMVRNPTDEVASHPSDRSYSNVCARQVDDAKSNTSAADSAVCNTSESNVCAGQADDAKFNTRVAPPPHPPEEVTTSSPLPLTDISGNRSVPSPRGEEEGAGYAEEDLRAAADVLQLLPDPWTQGRPNAFKLAPKLLSVMGEQGWPGIHEVDRALLTRQLSKNAHRVGNPYRLLATDRIPNLPRYAAVAAAASSSSSEDRCAKHPQYRAGNRCVLCVMA
ncbi:hypothetical protein [Streptomyces sp. 8L]|uniref:hypothetical protein n=1 Tax=Streptomyces sp. 8L TaxID=2877242 RepID=UPI001CD64469|nr:hypothetical protein [Streptomyces sp. 8L]MCA1222184.1 hypothetical protein [Streptomyces sp. 8L]